MLASLIVIVSARPGLSFAQQQSTFVATLSGKNMQPPVNTPATGTAKFSVNPNGTLSYEVDATSVDKVLAVPLEQKNGTLLAELLNVYANTGFTQGYNRQQASVPTGPINGKLTSGVLDNSNGNNLFGPLFGKNITDLLTAMKSGSVYVVIRTSAHQQGEIRGQITAAPPSTAPPAAAAPPSTAPPAAAAPPSNSSAAAAPPSNSSAAAPPSTAPPAAAAPPSNSSAAAAPPSNSSHSSPVASSGKGCVDNLLKSWSSNITSAHTQLVDKIAACFGQ
jgi:hypothetical protein